MSIPPVIVGLFVCLLFAREGLFGILNLLYTPYVMIIAQIILVTPIITSITLSAISNLSKNYKLQLLALGANNIQLGYYLLQEIKYQFLIALLVGFGRAISEVGAVMIVGGNIRWLTRVLTTAIVTQARQGEFTYALTLGIILLSLSFGINFFVNLKQQR
jgi:tungstate transport system permease protein